MTFCIQPLYPRILPNDVTRQPLTLVGCWKVIQLPDGFSVDQTSLGENMSLGFFGWFGDQQLACGFENMFYFHPET